ncbi:MAG: CotH kinase family protein [bacterium]|nr:CotH kinase family protein [bacterium]
MKSLYLSLHFLMLLAATSSFAQTGNILFSDATFHEIRFENIDTSTFFTYANKGVYAQAKITIDGIVMDSIGVTTKGNISWGHINNKKPLKINLNKYVSGKKYDGIKKFYLHNSYQDPSLMREKLTYDICKQMGLHSLRAAFAKVYINNVYWGVYTLLEAKDELYKRGFNNKDAEVFETLDFGSPCVYNQSIPYWTVDNGNPTSTWPQLLKMTTILGTTPSIQYLDTVTKYFNLNDFLKYQAINVYLLNFDSYLQFNGNQLYLFDSIFEKRMQIIPWDFNASFGLWNTNNYDPNTLDIIPSLISNKCPFDKINTIPQLKNIYLDAMCSLKNTYCDTTTLNNKITNFYNQIKTATYTDTKKEPTNTQFDNGAGYGYQNYLGENSPGLKTFVRERWVKINADLQNLPYTCSTTGINLVEQNSNSLLVYPNPFSFSITLHTDNLLSNATLTVINSFGQTVKELKNISGQTVTLFRENLPSGLYFILLTEDNKIISTEKLLVAD